MLYHPTAVNPQGLRAMANPNLGFLSKALVSTSPETVSTDLGMTSCCRRAPSFPWLLSFAFTTVRLSIAYDPPTVKVFSLVENFLVISPTAALFLNWSKWCTYDAFILSPLSPLRERERERERERLSTIMNKFLKFNIIKITVNQKSCLCVRVLNLTRLLKQMILVLPH